MGCRGALLPEAPARGPGRAPPASSDVHVSGGAQARLQRNHTCRSRARARARWLCSIPRVPVGQRRRFAKEVGMPSKAVDAAWPVLVLRGYSLLREGLRRYLTTRQGDDTTPPRRRCQHAHQFKHGRFHPPLGQCLVRGPALRARRGLRFKDGAFYDEPAIQTRARQMPVRGGEPSSAGATRALRCRSGGRHRGGGGGSEGRKLRRGGGCGEQLGLRQARASRGPRVAQRVAYVRENRFSEPGQWRGSMTRVSFTRVVPLAFAFRNHSPLM